MIIPDGFGHVLVPLKNSASGHTSAITWGFENTTGLTDPEDVADAVAAVAYPRLAPCQDNNVTIGPLVVRLTQGVNEFVGVASSFDTGDQNWATPPPNVAALVAKRGAAAGRTKQGRFFLPWAMDRSDVNEAGGIVPARVTQLQGEMTNLRANSVTGDVQMMILHNGVGSPTVVVSLTVSALVSTQRRRLGR